MTVIDLDLPASPPTAPAPPPVHRYRHLALVVAGVLALALGGAAPAAPVLWRHLGSIGVNDAEAMHAVAGDLVVVSNVTGDGTISAWRLDPPRRLWAVTLPEPPVARPVPLGDALLVQQADTAVAVLDRATGAVRWSSPSYVQQLNDRVGLVTETRFAPGTEYDETSGDPGPLYFSAAGQPHTAPPIRTDVHGTDLATGRRLWSAREAGAVYAVPVPGNPAELVVVTAGAVEIRDAATGAALRRRSLPRTGPRDVWYPEVAAGVLLVRRGAAVTAYGLDTLEPRWDRTEPDDDGGGFPFCQDLLCRRTTGGQVDVLDPRTGRTAWQPGLAEAQLLLGGGEVLVRGGSGERPQSIRDPATGAVRVDLRGWDDVIDFSATGALMVSRYDSARTGRVFGYRAPGATAVRPLGASTTLLRDCARSPVLVACRGTDRIEVFAYRAA